MRIYSLHSMLLSCVVVLIGACGQDEDAVLAIATEPVPAGDVDCSAAPAAVGCVDGRLLHVASPAWQDQIIYFAMIDRFNDGDPTNNDQGVNLYDPSRESHYSGGDIKGLTQKLDYIKNLGATAVWTTPQVANMWWDPQSNYGGYHGYWARDFKAVDEHYGSLDDYKDLSHALHTNGMYLIQDIVVNHMGNFFGYEGEYDPKDPTKNFVLNSEALPTSAPTQAPFHKINVLNPEHREAAIYHWTPAITNFSDYIEETTYQTAGLSDLNTANPVVRKALKDSFGYWIKEAGVDSFRIDTVKYVEKEFYDDFLHGEKGIKETALATGRKDFYTFGEVFNTSSPLEDSGEKKLSQYVTSAEHKRIDAPIGFPLYKEMGRVFSGGSPTQYLSYRLKAQMRVYHNPYIVANFIDNHDVERFLAGGSVSGFKLAYALMMTVPGVPVIYQGDEQLFPEFRRAMFAGGYQSEQDHFDENSPMYQYIKKLSTLRKQHPVFTRGTLEIIQDNPIAPGVLAYKRSYKGKVAYVLINTAQNNTVTNRLPTPFNVDNKPQILLAENQTEVMSFSENGNLTRVLPPQSLLIFMGDEKVISGAMAPSSDQIVFEKIENRYEDVEQAIVSGTISMPNASLLRVIDGDLDAAEPVLADEKGRWQFSLPVNDLGEKDHIVELYWPEKGISSEQKRYTVVATTPEINLHVKDPAGDDKGPTGRYLLPENETVGCEMDIRRVDAQAGGRILRLSLTMCRVSDLWQPLNLFDHVSFTTFFSVPEQPGVNVLPLIGGEFPEKEGWNFAHVAYGWGNYLYSATNADVQNEGKVLGLAPEIQVEKDLSKITFTYDAKHFGLSSWKDVGVYITTWDKDGSGVYRALGKETENWQFGGADASDPKILDDVFLRLE